MREGIRRWLLAVVFDVFTLGGKSTRKLRDELAASDPTRRERPMNDESPDRSRGSRAGS